MYEATRKYRGETLIKEMKKNKAYVEDWKKFCAVLRDMYVEIERVTEEESERGEGRWMYEVIVKRGRESFSVEYIDSVAAYEQQKFLDVYGLFVTLGLEYYIPLDTNDFFEEHYEGSLFSYKEMKEIERRHEGSQEYLRSLKNMFSEEEISSFPR